MSSVRDGTLVALVAHAREVPARDRAGFGASVRDRLATGGVVLETCHRVEAYLVTSARRVDQAVDVLPAGGEVLIGEAAVRHAVAVAVGRDSVVEGEDQVLHQMRATMETSRRAGGLDPVLDRLLTVALGAGRRARSWHHGPRRSLADAALEVIEERVGSLRRRPVLVVGAGTIGRLAARAAGALGADVAIASRTDEHARELALSTASRSEALDPGAAAGSYAGAVVALGGPWPVGEATTRAFAAATSVVVDLSQPPSVQDVLADVLDTRLVTADALARRGPAPVVAVGSRDRVDDLIDRTAAGFLDWLAARAGRDAAALLVDRAEREREAELAELWRRHPELGPEARTAIEAMSRHLAQRILRQPLERLGRDADGHSAEAARDLFSL